MSIPSNPPPRWTEVAQAHRRWQRPFIAVEWATEWVVYALERWALIRMLNLLAGFSVLAAVVTYCRGAPERRRAQADAVKAKHYQAWQVINSAQGKGGNGGRTDALQELYADGVELDGVNVRHARLRGISLPGAILSGAQADSADLVNADLRGVRLSGASLNGANLAWADLRGANLAGARLVGTNLEGASLDLADFTQADLRGASFAGASARHANFGSADLRRAQLDDMILDSAAFSNADLRRTRVVSSSLFNAAIIEGANIAGLVNRRADDAAMALLARRGTVSLGNDSAWAVRRDSVGDGMRTSGRFMDWSELRRRISNWDSLFPRPASTDSSRPRG